MFVISFKPFYEVFADSGVFHFKGKAFVGDYIFDSVVLNDFRHCVEVVEMAVADEDGIYFVYACVAEVWVYDAIARVIS